MESAVGSSRNGNTSVPPAFGGSRGPLGCVTQEGTTVG